MLRKIILGIVAFVFISTGVQAEGVGILDASEQADFTISCPEGAANCSEISTEAEDYSVSGTQDFVLRLLGGILNFAAIIAVLMLVIVGARLVIAMGNQEGLQAAKKQLLWTFGGLAVIILSLLIVRNITEKIYEAAQDCLSVAEDGLYSEKTGQAEGEAPDLASTWNSSTWPDDEEIFNDNILNFQKAFNQLECGGEDGDWLRVTGTTIDCLTLDVDGKHGPLTEEARAETENLAQQYGVDEITYAAWQADNSLVDGNVTGFQSAYNTAECDGTTGKRIDI
jgi:hypothetical protein